MIKGNFLACAITLISCSTALPSYAQWATTCTREYNSSVNMRKSPNRSSTVIASIPNDSGIRVMNWVWGGDGMRWYRVEFGGLVGWMRSDYMCR